MATAKKTDPRVKRTRRLLLDAFVALQAEKSFEDITVQDITDRATVNRATFYSHFIDKNALVDELTREGFAEILGQRCGEPAADAAVQLRRLFLAVTDHWQVATSHCQRTYQLFESLIEAQVRGQVRASVHAWLVERNLAPAEAVDLAATIVSWAIYGAAMEWTKCSDSEPAEAFAERALPMIVASLDAAGGRAA